MNLRALSGWSAVTVLAVALFAVAGCAKEPGGPYAEAKQTWDPPRSTEQLSQMRTRVATTQRDN